MKTRARRGVTLIETLVVLALIGLFASVAVLNAPQVRSGARDEAERFAAKLDVAQTLSLSSGAPVKAELTGDGYRFLVFRDRKWIEPAEARALQPHAFRRDLAVALLSLDAALEDGAQGARDEKTKPFLIDPLGGGGAVSVAFSDGGERWLVSLDQAGGVKVSRDAR